MSDSGTVMAAGMATSVVKVFILAKSQHDVVDVDEVIRRQVTESLAQNGKEVKPVKEKAKSDKAVKSENSKELDAKAQKKIKISEIMDDRGEFELVGHEGPVYAVSISVCDRHLLSGSFDRTVRRWSLQTRGPLMVYHAHQAPVWDVRFAPLGSYFVSCSADRSAKLWLLKNPKPLRIFVS